MVRSRATAERDSVSRFCPADALRATLVRHLRLNHQPIQALAFSIRSISCSLAAVVEPHGHDRASNQRPIPFFCAYVRTRPTAESAICARILLAPNRLGASIESLQWIDPNPTRRIDWTHMLIHPAPPLLPLKHDAGGPPVGVDHADGGQPNGKHESCTAPRLVCANTDPAECCDGALPGREARVSVYVWRVYVHIVAGGGGGRMGE